MIPVFRPYYDEREEQAVIKVFKSGWIGMGPKTEEFEEAFAKSVNSKYAASLNSCTAGLHICARLLDLKAGDETIVPTITFISTACVADYCQATPVFCDVRQDNLLIDWDDAKSRVTKNTKAIFPVLWAGQNMTPPDDMDLPLVYDCAQAGGGTFDAAGKLACWSFHAVKNIATGDGGMITTDDKDQYERIKRLRWMGINKSTWARSGNKSYFWEYTINEIGYKYHMNDITAAIGLTQLQKLPEMQKMRKAIYKQYAERLRDVVDFVPTNPDDASLYLFVIRTENRNELSEYLKSRGIATGVHCLPVHLYEFYYKNPLPVAERESKKILSLPLYCGLTESEIDFICDEIIKFKKLSLPPA